MQKLTRLFVFALLLTACSAPAAGAQIDPPFPTSGLLESNSRTYPVETGWFDGQTVRYYNMGTNTPLDPADPTKVLLDGVWVFATGVNPDGSPIPLDGQNNILDFAPGDPNYSDFWQV